MPKLDKSICREYLLLEGGVGMARPAEPLDSLGEPVEGVNCVGSRCPKESYHS